MNGEFLPGKKTYIVGALMTLLGIAKLIEPSIPVETGPELLIGTGLSAIFGRMGIAKVLSKLFGK